MTLRAFFMRDRTSRRMDDTMGSFGGEHFQIVRMVILAISVDVVNYFFAGQRPAELLLRDNPMVAHPSIADHNHQVAGVVEPSPLVREVPLTSVRLARALNGAEFAMAQANRNEVFSALHTRGRRGLHQSEIGALTRTVCASIACDRSAAHLTGFHESPLPNTSIIHRNESVSGIQVTMSIKGQAS